MKRISIGAFALLALLITLGLVHEPKVARAQDKQDGVRIWLGGPQPYAASLIPVSGKVGYSGSYGGFSLIAWDHVPAGEYELLVEANGFKQWRQHIFVPERSTLDFNIVLTKGAGVVVFGKGPTWEQLVERIAKLEDTINELKKKP